MSLLTLPNELLLLIADHLPLPSLLHLHLTNHRLHHLTTHHLHTHATLDRHSYGMVLPALHWAAWYNHLSLARLLLTTISPAPPIDAKTSEHGKTALQCAAWQGHIDMVRFLLDHGADINARDDRFGKSALHQAVVRGWTEVVQLLLQRGADVAARDHGGMTPLLWAVKCQGAGESLVGIFRMLLENAAATAAAAAAAGEEGDEGGDGKGGEGVVDAQEYERGETALHWAVWRGQRATVALLTEFGADADVASVDGETAVEWAVRKGDEEITRMVVGRCEVAEMLLAEEKAVVEGGAGGEGEGDGAGDKEEKGKRWGRRIRSIGKVVGRMSLMRQLERRQVKELGEV
ncbi:uncharacterized protein H6S33_009980 [Morchella sextelata]|uniref:uncharacterized protein n=1 Tax=Morchella sextelata TaxID=1174677 RepID=UPI001D05B10D|nr:uncharacterized protein H6S33_009980 [Morchella sextelata]KAH0611928.1 hypothetical protein H6S33_009980 [Morchella sextelata]